MNNPDAQADSIPINETTILHQGVLIVDDNEQNLELLHAYLDELGGDVHLARDGLEAIDSVANNPPDIILLDIMMPRMSGFQVCEKLKKDPSTRDIPIIMVTALNEVGDVERAIDSGADDFLTKPVNKLELLTRVRSLLRVRQLKRQLDSAVSEVRAMRDHAGE
jgi:two-component system alkaline phosphatase synthesis response regulator PhoP